MPLHRVEWQCSKDGPARHNGLCALETYGAGALCDERVRLGCKEQVYNELGFQGSAW